MPKLTFIERDGRRRTVDVRAGVSVMEAARANDVDIEGACEGAMACCTCHVVVEPEWFPRLAAPSADEQDMLELVVGLSRTSRLGCQIAMSDALDGLVVRLPKDVRNLLEG
jgi:2Fe-2S ferredoxin